MAIEQVENHGDPGTALNVLQDDELADAARIDTLGILGNQEESRLRIKKVAIGL